MPPITTPPFVDCYLAIFHLRLGTDFAVIALHKLRSQHLKLAIYKVLMFYAKKAEYYAKTQAFNE